MRTSINLHGGLKPGQLRHKYYRRLRDLDLRDRCADRDAATIGSPDDDDYLCDGPCCEGEFFAAQPVFNQLIREAINPLEDHFALLNLPPGAGEPAPMVVSSRAAAGGAGLMAELADATGSLEKSLQEFTMPGISLPLPSLWELRPAFEAFAPEAITRARQVESLFSAAYPLVLALLFSKFWVRPLNSWRPPAGTRSERIRSLVQHLFAHHAVPDCLLRPWTQATAGSPQSKWVLWLIIMGRGANLHQAASRFGWEIPARFVSFFLQTADIDPAEACMWAEVMRLGGSEIEFRRIRDHQGFRVDPTSLRDRYSWQVDSQLFLVFWRDTVRWLTQHRDALDDPSASQVLDWAIHRFTESERRAGKFSWGGRSARAVLRAAADYQRALSCPPVPRTTWDSRNLDWSYKDEGVAEQWSVTELCSANELHEEGVAMRHCVGMYAAKCASGSSAIFSLRRDGERAITIEINPGSLALLQARGRCNRRPHGQEQRILSTWLTWLRTRARSPNPHISTLSRNQAKNRNDGPDLPSLCCWRWCAFAADRLSRC